ncbi:hypothetical protein TeGR_g415 [Tetraparma gracilis]|uniref:NFACT protein C-terminal domain-containing protein n=1 Tax=Tetraparma gracilis TaxID=2962635 RepID=A0ABQ6MCV1_9STRA|nr:hypothetical protein TeGR_g415 [Tetraparma gracilis]
MVGSSMEAASSSGSPHEGSPAPPASSPPSPPSVPNSLLTPSLSPFHVLSLLASLSPVLPNASVSAVYVTQHALHLKLHLPQAYAFEGGKEGGGESTKSVWLSCSPRFVTLSRAVGRDDAENREATTKLRSLLKNGRLVRVQQGEVEAPSRAGGANVAGGGAKPEGGAGGSCLPSLSRTLLIPILTPASSFKLLLQLHSAPNLLLLSPDNVCVWCLHKTAYIRPNAVPALKPTPPVTSAEAYVQKARAAQLSNSTDHPAKQQQQQLTLKQTLKKQGSPLAPAGEAFIDHVLQGLEEERGPGWDTVDASGLDEVVARELGRASDKCKKAQGWVLYEDPKDAGSPEPRKRAVPVPVLLRAHGRLGGGHVVPAGSFLAAVNTCLAVAAVAEKTGKLDRMLKGNQDRVGKIERQNEMRVRGMRKEMNVIMRRAGALRSHAEAVENLGTVLKSYVARKIQWTEIDEIIAAEKANGNPLALLIESVDWENSRVQIRLPWDPERDGEDLEDVDMSVDYDEEVGGKAVKKKKKKQLAAQKGDLGAAGGEERPENEVVVLVDWNLTPHANAKRLFDEYKATKEKMAKVELNQGKAVEAVKKKTEKAESSIRRSNNRQVSLTSKGGQHWFCDTAGSLCIRWCITRSGHLFIYSSEPRDLDYIVKTFLDPADTLVRMDSPCGGVIKSKYRPLPGSDDDDALQPFPISLSAVNECATLVGVLAEHSSTKTKSSVVKTLPYYAKGSAVSKKAPNGAALDEGQVHIRGKKEYVRAGNGDFGFGVVFEKKGLSAKDRKLIKKYGSLEAAMEAARIREEAEADAPKKPKKPEPAPDTESLASTSTRGGGGKKNAKKMKKYMDQDDEDRELAMLALHGGPKQSKEEKKKNKSKKGPPKKLTEKDLTNASTLTQVLGATSVSTVTSRLSPEIKEYISDAAENKLIDILVLEELARLPAEGQVAAVDRLQQLLADEGGSNKGGNLSKSLMGIISIVDKWGAEAMRDKIKSHAEGGKEGGGGKKEAAAAEAEGVEGEEEGAERGVRDVTPIIAARFTHSPASEDKIVRAYPVLGSFESMKQWRYRVKLVGGAMKRGKASKQALETMCLAAKDKGGGNNEVDFIRAVNENEFIAACVGDVRVVGQGVNKVVAAQKSQSKKEKADKNAKKSKAK